LPAISAVAQKFQINQQRLIMEVSEYARIERTSTFREMIAETTHSRDAAHTNEEGKPL
jgi:hypothetical protein